jgi:hypothetical protein
MASIWASIRPGAEPMSRASTPRPEAPPQTVPSEAMQAAVREAVGSASEPRRPPPKLGPADTPHPAVPPRAAPVVVRRRTGWGYAIAWALGIGVGAVAAGAFVGFLVNGPPGHSSSHRQIADVAPPTPDVPPPTMQEIAGSKSASAAQPSTPATVATAMPNTASPSSQPATARSALPPIPPAKPGTQATSPSARPSAPSPPLASNDIREMQGRLQSLGFDPGPVDGAAGPKTAAALIRYQQAHGLQPTGLADKETLDELRHEPGSTPPPPPPPPRPRAVTYQSAYTPQPPRQSNPLLDALDRLFGR